MRHDDGAQLTGTSKEILELKQEIERVAKSESKVLVTGETGSGKEIVARAVHRGSPRAGSAFVPVNCAGLPETLLESELFGHVKGSFTGAYRDKPGKLELGHNGTVFLDEIGEMTLRMQGLLLRFLETGEIQKVGTDRALGKVDVRVIAATNRDLREMITQRLFREDLFFRLNVIHLIVPALRQRQQDIPALVEHFLTRFTRTSPGIVREISPEAMRALCEYSWPGNVRELENVIERLVVTGRTPTAQLQDLPPEIAFTQQNIVRPAKERRRTIADNLYTRIRQNGESFWNVVYPSYMQREISRTDVREVMRKGLEESRGNYRICVRLFNIESTEYKKFLNFLRKHDCQLPYKEYR
jgi:transcriptional regulator with PAS, ATPase and Fis domain